MLVMSSPAERATRVPSREDGAAARDGGWSVFPAPTGGGSVWRWRPTRVATVAFVLGLLVTAGFALASLRLYDRNESRLLRLRAREVSSVLVAVVPSIQTPLASAAELADATGGDPR